MNNEELFLTITELENGIGIKEGFFKDLLFENDWSFIIKLHALYEAAISNLITEKLGQVELAAFVSRLELGDRSRGKLRLSKDLNLLDEEERKFVYALSEIRNDFVHNIKYTNANLETYLEGLSKDRRKHYINTFGYTYDETIEIVGHKVNSNVFTRENPKIAIWHNSIHVLALIFCLTATEQSKQSINQSKKFMIYKTVYNRLHSDRSFLTLLYVPGDA